MNEHALHQTSPPQHLRLSGRCEPGSQPVLLYLVTEDWYFLSHRLPMACAAQRAGYEVHVATRVGRHGVEIEKCGFALHPLNWQRGSLNPLALASIVSQVRSLYRALAPDLVHHVALQPAIIGSLAATGLPVTRLNALAGLGFGFTSGSFKARLIRPVLVTLLRMLLRNKRAWTLVQNPDDREQIVSLGIPAQCVALIPGSGVDADGLCPLPEPDGPPTIAFVGRLLADKGVRTLMDAQAVLAKRGEDVHVLVAGDRDPANPASIAEDEIAEWSRRAGVTFLGHVADIREVWKRAHVAVLPSRREGLPKSLLEAAACGRPIVATNVPGCREIAHAGLNALLVPPDDAEALAAAIATLARDADMRRRFGEAGRKLVEDRFASERIGAQTVALYDRLVGRSRTE